MTNNSSLGNRIVAQELLIQNLLTNCTLIGGIYTMGYDECMVLTNDLWKNQAGGIPQHCFLLATAMMPREAPNVEDEEVILLRVIGPAALPAEAELVQVREQAMREMVIARGAEGAASSPAILDVLTRNEIQFSGIKAKILGTFYDTDVIEYFRCQWSFNDLSVSVGRHDCFISPSALMIRCPAYVPVCNTD